MNYRPVTLYPLIVLPKKLKINPTTFFECIKIENFPENEITIQFKGESNTYTVIGDRIDSTSNSIVQGRFVKFNKEIKGKIKENPPSEAELGLAVDEYLEEETFFLYDTKNGIIIAEYNPRAVNVLFSRATLLLDKVLYKCQNIRMDSLSPIPVGNFLDKIRNKGHARKIRISLKWANIDYLEKIGITSRKLKLYGGNIDFEISQQIKYRTDVVTSDQFLQNINELRAQILDKGKSLKIYTDKGNFDLIRDNFVSYEIHVDNDGNHAQIIDRFHDLVFDQYMKSQENLKSMVYNFVTMDDFTNEETD